MRLRWIIPIAFLLPLHLAASEPVVAARTATVLINPGEVTLLHLRPEFNSVIRMPEEVTSVCGANSSSNRRLATVTSILLRAKAWARAWPIFPNPRIA